MAIASGVDKQVIYKAQANLDSPQGGATGSGGQILRRTSSSLELKKNTFQSNEIRTDYQIADFRHGSKYVEGAITGELSPATYSDFMGAAVRRAFAAVTTISTLTLTVATGTPNSIGRSTGSWLTDGVKVGDIIRLTGGLNAANINKNLMVVNVVALTLSVITLDGSAMATNATGIASCTCTFPGKKTFVPTSGHVATYYTIEQWYSSISVSEAFLDCKVNTMDVQIPASGMATCSFGFLGRNISIGNSSRFSSPSAATTSGVLAGANGILAVGTTPGAVATVTGLNFTINGGMSKEDVVGANSTPDVFNGSVVGTGQATILLENDTYMQMFEDETEATLIMSLTTGSSANAEFISFCLPRIKVGGNSKDDGQKGIVQTVPFQILLQGAGGTGTKFDQTTISIQDSMA